MKGLSLKYDLKLGYFLMSVFAVEETLSVSDSHDAHRLDSFAVYANKALVESPQLQVALLHGGGHSAYSWALVVSRLAKALPDSRLVSFDFRAHGNTLCTDEKDLSADRLVEDCINVLERFCGSQPIVLVGHSLGGAIAVRTAASKRLEHVVGLVVLDLVEGSAMAALPLMPMFLNARPESFASPEEAIRWSLRSGIIKNRESAAFSVPRQLKRTETGWTWKTDLLASEPFWEGWYRGLSKTFLSVSASKMLIVAGTDRMDTELTVAQMQGKFRFVLLPDSVGHLVQEDCPDRVAEELSEFIIRNKFVESWKLNEKLRKLKKS